MRLTLSNQPANVRLVNAAGSCVAKLCAPTQRQRETNAMDIMRCVNLFDRGGTAEELEENADHLEAYSKILRNLSKEKAGQ